MITAQQARLVDERRAAEALLADGTIERTKRALAEEGLELGTRRSLLARALRLTPAVAPRLHSMLGRNCERLGITQDVELYVYASPSFNAACTPPEGDRVFVLFSSSLLEAFETAELSFVLGHELGHHVYAHHDIPVGVLLSDRVSIKPALAIQLYTWQRLAEISADRAGVLCSGDFESAARAFFKLSSGLTRVPGEEEIRAFVQQAEALFEESAALSSSDQKKQMDWASSHPFSPIRLRAAEYFVGSEAMTAGGRSLEDIDVDIRDLLGLMEESYLTQDTPEAETMRRALFAAGVTLAARDGRIASAERDALEDLLGPGRIPLEVSPEAVEKVLDERLAKLVGEVSHSRRVQWMRDLTRIALADGRVYRKERSLLVKIAKQIEVSPRVVDATLAAPRDLD